MFKALKRNCIVVLLPLIAACGTSPENVTGGPCTYDKTDYPAVIISIYATDSLYSEIQLAALIGTYTDTVYYSSGGRGYILNEELISKGYKTGDTLIYRIQEIRSGSCSPLVKMLVIERYKK